MTCVFSIFDETTTANETTKKEVSLRFHQVFPGPKVFSWQCGHLVHLGRFIAQRLGGMMMRCEEPKRGEVTYLELSKRA